MSFMLQVCTLTTLLQAAGDPLGNPVAPGDPPLAEPVYVEQALSASKPSALEFWVRSPKRHQDYPWNIIRMWFPEAAGIAGDDGAALWEYHMVNEPAQWHYVDGGLRAELFIPGGGRFLRSVRMEGATAYFEMTFENRSGQTWHGANAGSCLQLSAAPDYEDNLGERTYWILDGELTPTSDLAITDPGMRGSCGVGQSIPLKNGQTKTVTEGALFVTSRDSKYVLGYAWRPASGLFYNRAGITACNHVQPPSFDIPPSERRTARGILFVQEGTVEQARDRYMAWKNMEATQIDQSPELDASFLNDCAFVSIDIQPDERTVSTEESLPEAWRQGGITADEVNAAADHKFDVAFPNAKRVVTACRALGLPVIFVHWGFAFPDGMDLAPEIRAFVKATFGPDPAKWPNHLSDPGARPADFLEPREGEYVISKTDHDAFVSSNIDHVLKNLGVKNLIFVGGHTDACLGKTAVAAKERGYTTLCVSDATFAGVQSLWEPGLLNSRFDYIITTEEFLRLVEAKGP
jgi:nicotinamidase-related amidase